MKKENYNKILLIIKAIRLSFLESAIVYTRGACYGFYQILKAIYPQAEAYMTNNGEHIVTKIDDKYYDIQGEYIDNRGEPLYHFSKINKKQHSYWESIVSTQRVEIILNKE